jgi:nicotinamide-nucleotide amidase
MFPHTHLDLATQALALARAAGVRLATAETVTAGLVSACLTSVAGASQVFERGFVLYHDSAKASGLGVPETVARRHGAVSAEITQGLAEGALAHSGAGAAVAVTGYAGPGGGTDANPVGTVFVAAARRGQATLVERRVFSGDRNAVRVAAVGAALELLVRRLAASA